jgi:hypothetical protein
MQDKVNAKLSKLESAAGNDSGVNGLRCSPLPLTVIAYSAGRGDNNQPYDRAEQSGGNVVLPFCPPGYARRRRNEQMAKIQFELPDEKLAELEALQKEARLETRKDLFNTALTLFEWAVEEVKAGRAIASVDENNSRYREIVMPALRSVAPSKNGSKSKGS